MNDMNHNIAQAAHILKEKIGNAHMPKLAILLGSGLNVIADEFHKIFEISYTDLPGYPQPTTKGHAGKVTACDVKGKTVLFMQGRQHYYETDGSAAAMSPMKVMIRSLKILGVESLLATNAAGSINEDTPPGSLVAIKDHINFPQFDVLRGPNDMKDDETEWGPRFLDLASLWDKKHRNLLHEAAGKASVSLRDGIYCMFSGPSFETAAEVKLVKALGADTVGMSVLPEAMIGHHCGLKIMGCSAITNLANGISREKLSHTHTLEGAKKAKDAMKGLIQELISLF